MPLAAFKCVHCGKAIVEEDGACSSCRLRVGISHPNAVVSTTVAGVFWGITIGGAIVLLLILMG